MSDKNYIWPYRLIAALVRQGFGLFGGYLSLMHGVASIMFHKENQVWRGEIY